jgi:serine/threonine-protein kinase
VWSADGKTIYYIYIEPTGRKSTIMRKPADGSREAEPIAVLDGRAYIDAVTPDEKFALIDYAVTTPGGGRGDVMKMALSTDATREALVASPSDQYAASWSPDRRWLAYISDETGREEIYVRDMSSTGGRWQVSTTGGNEPHWSPDGRELYYRNGGRLMSVAVESRTTFEPKTPVVLFEGVYDMRSDTGVSYAVDPKGGRFLMVRLAGDNAASTIIVVTHWFDELQRLTSGP